MLGWPRRIRHLRLGTPVSTRSGSTHRTLLLRLHRLLRMYTLRHISWHRSRHRLCRHLSRLLLWWWGLLWCKDICLRSRNGSRRRWRRRYRRLRWDCRSCAMRHRCLVKRILSWRIWSRSHRCLIRDFEASKQADKILVHTCAGWSGGYASCSNRCSSRQTKDVCARRMVRGRCRIGSRRNSSHGIRRIEKLMHCTKTVRNTDPRFLYVLEKVN